MKKILLALCTPTEALRYELERQISTTVRDQQD